MPALAIGQRLGDQSRTHYDPATVTPDQSDPNSITNEVMELHGRPLAEGAARGGVARLTFGETRAFWHSGKNDNNLEGFEEALAGFLLSQE
jgi:hypothetical protein